MKSVPKVPDLEQDPNKANEPLLQDPKEREAKVAQAREFVETTLEEISELSERVRMARLFIARNAVGRQQASLAECVAGFHASVKAAAKPAKKTRAKAVAG